MISSVSQFASFSGGDLHPMSFFQVHFGTRCSRRGGLFDRLPRNDSVIFSTILSSKLNSFLDVDLWYIYVHVLKFFILSFCNKFGCVWSRRDFMLCALPQRPECYFLYLKK